MGEIKKTGILLVNLGTPEAPTTPAVRAYLREFLSDSRVIEIARIPWMLILHGIILNSRPKVSAQKYKQVWSDEGAPLLAIAHKQAQCLTKILPSHYEVVVAMRYGMPSIETGMKKLIDAAVDKIIVFPLYPQYCSATTASVFDKVAEILKNERFFPELHFLGAYYQTTGYLDACMTHLNAALKEKTIDQLIFSYHGMPLTTYQQGDPYYDQCLATSTLIAHRLGLDETAYATVFQSRFGRAEWLKPYAAEYLPSLPAQGIKNVAVFCPGFSADCLETLEEIGEENRDIFLEAGGMQYNFIPCLNDKDYHINALKACLLS